VNALSFGQAEKHAVKHMKGKNIIGEVVGIITSNVCFVDKFTHGYMYKVKIVTEGEDEMTGKLKKVWYYELLSADTPEEAIQKARDKYKEEYGSDYTIDQSSKIPVTNVLNY
jgi:hypothetical protein